VAGRRPRRERPAHPRLEERGGHRSIAISPTLSEALGQQRRRAADQGDGARVFASEAGGIYRAETFKEALEAALVKAGVQKRPRPFHDLRHTAITNDAASGSSPIAVMTKAGHANLRTTKRYMHLAGVVFRDEAERLEERLLGGRKFYPSEPISDDVGEPEPRNDAVSEDA